MPNESYFMTFGGLGLSLAGFAGLIATLTPSRFTSSVITGYRVRTIVFLGFSLTFVGFGTVAVYGITAGDLDLTVRIGTLLMTIPFLRGLLIDSRPGPVWPYERERKLTILVLLIMLLLTLGNLVVASVAYLQGLMLLGLIGPVSIFYNTIRDATTHDAPAAESGPTEAEDAPATGRG